MTDEKPRKTLSITCKPVSPTAVEQDGKAPTGIKRTGKRIITRDQLPQAAPAKPKPPKPKPSKAKKPPRKPVRKLVTPPSELRARELNDSLNGFAVWLQRQPLALGIEKQVFRYIADHHLSASKRVVQRLLYAHTHRRDYLQAVAAGGMRYGLDGQEAEAITAAERDYAGQRLATLFP
ncbi:Fertility inhibition FinO [Thiothrix litoralis]|uniref:Fertility inhibition FinO n=1 Tax=Thiothrix litoralis TaxID=2891210 RepID=A0ABX7WQ23_9GAMM|nr:ProQ/FINO family protein [Thiothrix litoralis]QTR45517.1 Fertility inhibition FinO [Thiothrix litoralis]